MNFSDVPDQGASLSERETHSHCREGRSSLRALSYLRSFFLSLGGKRIRRVSPVEFTASFPLTGLKTQLPSLGSLAYKRGRTARHLFIRATYENDRARNGSRRGSCGGHCEARQKSLAVIFARRGRISKWRAVIGRRGRRLYQSLRKRRFRSDRDGVHAGRAMRTERRGNSALAIGIAKPPWYLATPSEFQNLFSLPRYVALRVVGGKRHRNGERGLANVSVSQSIRAFLCIPGGHGTPWRHTDSSFRNTRCPHDSSRTRISNVALSTRQEVQAGRRSGGSKRQRRRLEPAAADHEEKWLSQSEDAPDQHEGAWVSELSPRIRSNATGFAFRHFSSPGKLFSLEETDVLNLSSIH